MGPPRFFAISNGKKHTPPPRCLIGWVWWWVVAVGLAGLAGWLVGLAGLAGWLVGLVGLAGWLVGWLVGCALHAASGFLCGSRKRGFAPRSVHAGGVACGHEGTNHIAPPSVDDSCPSKRPRHLGTGRSGRQSVLKRRLSYAQPPDRSRPVPRVTSTAECSRPASASSSSQPAVAPAVSASLERGTKRKAGVPHRIRPKPKARSTGLDAIEAFRRLQAARADPLPL